MYISKIRLFVLCLLLAGCTPKTTVSKPIYLQIKSPNISLSDAGFLTNTDSKKELVVFEAGNAIFKLSLNHLACLNSECGTRGQMLDRLAIKGMPDTLLDDLLDSKPLAITSAKCNKNEKQGGFEQSCKNDNFDIVYTLENGNISFADKLNRIIIKITEIEQ